MKQFSFFFNTVLSSYPPTPPPPQHAYAVYKGKPEEDLKGLGSSEAVAAAYQNFVGEQGREARPSPEAATLAPSADVPADLLFSHAYSGPNVGQHPPAANVVHPSRTASAPVVSPSCDSPDDSAGAAAPPPPGVTSPKGVKEDIAALMSSAKSPRSNTSFGARSDMSDSKPRNSTYFSNTNVKHLADPNATTNSHYYTSKKEKGQKKYGTDGKREGITIAEVNHHANSNSSPGSHGGCLDWMGRMLSNLLPFYVLCLTFGMARCAMWGMSAKNSYLVQEKVQLTFFIIPSLLYLVMLSLLMTSWWSAFCAISAFHHHEGFDHFKIPYLMYAGYILELLIFGFFLYSVILSKEMSGRRQQEVTYAMVFAFFAMGCIMSYIGFRMRKTLESLPYSFRGLLVLKARVRRISVVVAGTLFLRALCSVIQFIHFSHEFTKFMEGEYFVFIFYLFLEVVPVVVMLRSLGKARPHADVVDAEQPAAPLPKRCMSLSREEGTQGNAPATGGRRAFSSTTPALGLNMAGCKRSLALATPPPQSLEGTSARYERFKGLANTGSLAPQVPVRNPHTQQRVQGPHAKTMPSLRTHSVPTPH